MNLIQIVNENLSISDDVVGIKLPQIKLETNTGKLRGKTAILTIETLDLKNKMLYLQIQTLSKGNPLSIDESSKFLLEYLGNLSNSLIDTNINIATSNRALTTYLKEQLSTIAISHNFSSDITNINQLDYIVSSHVNKTKMEEVTSGIYELLKKGHKILEYIPNLPFDTPSQDWNDLTLDNLKTYESYIKKIIENNLLDRIYFITSDTEKTESYISRVRNK